jgi:hypothetical protein
MELAPLAAPITAALTIRVGLLEWRRSGVPWTGTLHPAELLRPGNRVRVL